MTVFQSCVSHVKSTSSHLCSAPPPCGSRTHAPCCFTHKSSYLTTERNLSNISEWPMVPAQPPFYTRRRGQRGGGVSVGSHHWDPLQIRPPLVQLCVRHNHQSQWTRPLVSVYAHTASHTEPSLSARQQALFRQLLSEGSALVARPGTHTEPVAWSLSELSEVGNVSAIPMGDGKIWSDPH